MLISTMSQVIFISFYVWEGSPNDILEFKIIREPLSDLSFFMLALSSRMKEINTCWDSGNIAIFLFYYLFSLRILIITNAS